MQFWQSLPENPSGEKSMNDFAASIDKIQKIVFSHSLKEAARHSTKLSSMTLVE